MRTKVIVLVSAFLLLTSDFLLADVAAPDTPHEAHNASLVSTISVTHTATGSNRLAVIFVSGVTARTISSMTYDGASCSSLGAYHTWGGSSEFWTDAWYRIAPSTTVGATVTANLSGNDTPSIQVYTFTGVDQATPVTFANIGTNGVSVNTISVAVTSAVTGMVVSAMETHHGVDTITQGANQLGQLDSGNYASGAIRAASSYKAGAASVTVTYSWTTNDYSTLTSVPINTISVKKIVPLIDED